MTTPTALAVLVLVVTSGCGDDSSVEGGVAPLWLPDHVAETLSPTYLASLQERIARAVGVQADILADGVVTPADMERAALAVLACVEEQGVSVVDFSYERGVMEITFTHEGTPGPMPSREDAIYNRCVTANFDLVAEVRGLQAWPTEQERQRLLGALRDCIREHGVEDQFTEDLEFVGSDPEAFRALVTCGETLDRDHFFGP